MKLPFDVKETAIMLIGAWFLYGAFKSTAAGFFDDTTTPNGVLALMQLVQAIAVGIIWWQYTRLREYRKTVKELIT